MIRKTTRRNFLFTGALRELGCCPILLGIFLVSLALRVLEITIPLNVDEVSWLFRGTVFFKSLFDGNLADTYLRHHPGVTNMWLYGTGMVFNCWLQRLFPGLLDLNQSSDLLACLDTIKADSIPINLYVLPRLLQAVITSACIVGIYILAKRLLGRPTALAAISLLILEPFFLAYQRLITTDALSADFSILAVLLLLLYLREDGKRQSLLASGVFMGLATASKMPALFILPAIVVWIVLIELGVWRASFPRRGWMRQIFDLTIWGVSASAAIFLIWPAFWVAPLETWEKLYTGLLEEADRGALFFLGQFTDSPGLLFYPLVLAYRLSPLLQVGFLPFLAALLVPRLRRHLDQMPELVAIALIPLSVLFILSGIDSKIDRYTIMVLPELALLAGAGLHQIGTWVKPWGRILNWSKKEGIKTAIALAAIQLFLLVPHYPYYITYYNPLLGGSQVARHLFMLGQGDGLDQAARWLNQLPNAKQVIVASWYSPVFSAYFQGQTSSLPKFRKDKDFLKWTKANSVVLYFNQLQRQLPEPKILDYFRAQQPLYTVQVDGIDYVKVYPGPVPLPEDLERIQFPLSLSFGEQIRLLGYDLNNSDLKSGDELVVTFYWQFLESPPPDLTLNISLGNRDGNLLNSSEASLLNGYLSLDQIAPGTVIRDVRKLTIATGTLPGHYHLKVGWFSPNKGQALEVSEGQGNSLHHTLALVHVGGSEGAGFSDATGGVEADGE